MPTFSTEVEWRASSNHQLIVQKINEHTWQVIFPAATVEPRLHNVGGPQSVDDDPIEPK